MIALALLPLAGMAFGAPVRAAASTKAGVAPLSSDDRRRALIYFELLLDDGRLGEADDLVRQGLALSPTDPDWLLCLARLRGAQQRHSESQALYRELLERSPDDVGLLLQFGQQAAAAGDMSTARKAYLKARSRSGGPQAPYYLSELEFSEGETSAGLSYAREALAFLASPKDSTAMRMRLRLLSRFNWDDGIDEQYARLFARYPAEPETLEEWADALIRAGLPEAAREPVRLLRERFPNPPARWRLLEAERLRAGPDDGALLTFLEDSVRRLPDDPTLRMQLAEEESRVRDYPLSEGDSWHVLGSQSYGTQADQLLSDVRRMDHHFLGTDATWCDDRDARSLALGASYEGPASEHLRLKTQASEISYIGERGVFTGEHAALSGGNVQAVYDTRRWTAGADVDARGGSGHSFFSPGLLGGWRPDGVSFSAQAWLGRAWSDVPESAIAGAKTDGGQLSFQTDPWHRLTLGGLAADRLVTLPDGSQGHQTQLDPEVDVDLLNKPFHAMFAYRFLSVNATGSARFFTGLPLQSRTRQQQLILSAGRNWLDGRLRGDAYVFNGQDAEYGQLFFTAALVGAGAHLDWLLNSWRLLAGYEYTQENVFGAGGPAHLLSAAVQYHWAPRRALEREGRP